MCNFSFYPDFFLFHFFSDIRLGVFSSFFLGLYMELILFLVERQGERRETREGLYGGFIAKHFFSILCNDFLLFYSLLFYFGVSFWIVRLKMGVL